MDDEAQASVAPHHISIVPASLEHSPLTSLAQYLPTEATFQALLESAPDAIVIVDAEGRILIVNNQVKHIFGYTSDELVGRSVDILLPDRLRTLHSQHRASYVATPRTRPMGVGLELVARRKDGSEFPVEISLSAIHTENGFVVTSVIRDVSERKQAEEALRQQTAQLRAQANLLNLAHDAIIVRDLTSTITFWNPGAEELYGWTKDEAVGQVSHVLLQTQFPQTLIDIDATLNQDGRWEGELVHVRRDGTRVVVASRQAVQRNEQGMPVAFLEINHDITERKQAADALERQVQRRTSHLNALLQFSRELLTARGLDTVLQRAISHAMGLVPEAQSGAIYLYDTASERLALRASVGFRQLPDFSRPLGLGVIGRAFTTRRTQLAQSADVGTRVADIDHERKQQQLPGTLPPQETPSSSLAIPLLAHDQAVGVLLLQCPQSNGMFVAEAQATLEGLANLAAMVILEEHSAHQAATLSHQVAHLEAQQHAMNERLSTAEAAMLQAARLAAVGQLAASIAHEINNPLYAVRNCLYLLEEDLAPEMRSSPYIALARDQLARIARIIERMRDFYRPIRGEMAAHDLNQLLEETLTLAGLNVRHSAVEVIFTPDPDLRAVVCNGDQLRQVFLNLILNAIDAMPDGGTLTVRTAAGPTVAVIEIQDTGIGIPETIRARLFEPFFTNKPNGTGLGLSVSAHIVTQHGGQIEVDSREGQGSTFRIVLPYQPSS